MKVILDFEYLNEPIDDDPRIIELEMESNLIPSIGDTISYEFTDGSGEVAYKVEDRIFTFSINKFSGITIFLKNE